jgi:putative oxygen-independent coproporphyrinogen III oxidase
MQEQIIKLDLLNANLNTKIIANSKVKESNQNKDTLLNFTSLPPLSLYIHIPWCQKKCPYCDFNSHENKNSIDANKSSINKQDELDYVQALENDLIATLPLIWGRGIHSVFIGGGTPSLLSEHAIEAIMQMLHRLLPMSTCVEITIEANPGSSEAHKFKSFAANGINRVSLGIQSFNDTHLQLLGRVHNNKQAMQAIDAAHSAFANINLDIMYALPEQNIQQAYIDIQHAISCDTSHISLYHLTLEPNTYFAKYPPNIPNDDTAFEMQDILINELDSNNFSRYEISAYAKIKGKDKDKDKNKGKTKIKISNQSKHNLNYWNFGDYIGIGAGAHGKISLPDKIIRYVKHKHPQSYIQKAIKLDDAQNSKHIIEQRVLNKSELPFEFMLGALRLIDGSSTANFYERTSLGYHYIHEQVDLAVQKKLMHNIDGVLRPTSLGLQFLNDLQVLFLS